ncbi:AraC family transcriptional regulator [Burkholderia gladioli pv. gladioli]|uniref:Helix-turn-helix domain protein n=1 Tax=Burkholderia gladioli TaxID=28095 RepID=A0AAW3F5P8_BURGA|nr:AraC family transcriptional regulator [Burkholderia gladioli]AJX00297.1 helix-turn-helix domain protein [Burkholderia gladioli]ASD81076.1 AraC family transcriptional regulator [Burkholderia gladioli pv. gladioli]AWY53692.1 AraC family transcriptional regulator [Burkholderia gladioli pv. gladioli]KGC16638.1 helix-turn-helix domain protein [Burkholderia gladioli]MDJ1161444.1 AraC family transcriptional regulator [Burkholderia gladioli pv. gladioli]
MPGRQARIIELIGRLAPNEGYTASLLPGVSFMRSNRSLGRTPVLYEPSIVLVCQGCKRGFLGDEVFLYDANHYLVLSVPLPFSTETEASPEAPLLAVTLRLDPGLTAELMLAVDVPGRKPPAMPRGIYSTPLNQRLSATLLRLLEALGSPLEARVVAPLALREICFLVLTGEQGDAMRASLASTGHFSQIARALRRIHADYGQPIDVESLCRESGMSVPSFHRHFKAVTHTTPIQYLKSTRLHQARLLMIRRGLTAAAASASVGYESPSQFSREFKRMFGRSPTQEVEQMRAAFAWSESMFDGGI